jgi:hypothetical protein
MPIQTINLGSYANDGSGDDLRTAFRKVNENFSLLGTDVPIAEGTNLGVNSIVVSRFLNKTSSAPFLVTLVISQQSVIPATNQYYYLNGNTNPLYNGHWLCTDSTLTSITLRYPTDPGVYGTADGTTISSTIGIFKDKNDTTAEFKSLTSSDNSINIVAGANIIDLRSGAGVQNDTAPVLGGNLNINGRRVIDTVGTGNIETNVYGINVGVLNAMFGMMLQTQAFNMDMGIFIANYNTIDIDMGFISAGMGPLINNDLDFGRIA